MNWCRLWHDMPNDPKWRSIARASGRRIGDVIAVFVHMLVSASKATERGRTQGWNDEDIASALDMEPGDVLAIREAMQGRVIDGDLLTGWEKRQPKREDESAERAKLWRERARTQPNANERIVTQGDAPEKRREEKRRKVKSFVSFAKKRLRDGARLPLCSRIAPRRMGGIRGGPWVGPGSRRKDIRLVRRLLARRGGRQGPQSGLASDLAQLVQAER